jgi:hypothetical protein
MASAARRVTLRPQSVVSSSHVMRATLCRATDLITPCSSHTVVAVLPSKHPEEGRQQMISVLSATRSWLSAGHWPTKLSSSATLVPDDAKVSTGTEDDRLLIRWPLLGKQTLRVIAFLITVCVVVAAVLAWQSSRQTIASLPPAAALRPSPDLRQQLEAMTSSLAAVRQSIDELSSDLGQMRRDITNLQTTEQAIFDKISEPRPAAAPSARPTPRPSQAPTPAR